MKKLIKQIVEVRSTNSKLLIGNGLGNNIISKPSSGMNIIPNNFDRAYPSSSSYSTLFQNVETQFTNNDNIEILDKKTVVLCHGCFGFASQFFFIEKKLIESGKYRVLNYWYPSYRQSIERSSEGLFNFLNEHKVDEEHVLSRSAAMWYSNYKEQESTMMSRNNKDSNSKNENGGKKDSEGNEYHFVTHSMGSMIVRNFLVNNVQNNMDKCGNISDILMKQDTLKLIQVSPLLNGRVKLARDLKFLYPIAKFLRSYPDEATIVEQFMNHVESEGWEEVFDKSFWWNPDSILSKKVKMTNIVTSTGEFQQKEPSLFSDLVLTVDEQTATLPLHLNDHTELVYIKGDHASILNKDICIDKILQVLG